MSTDDRIRAGLRRTASEVTAHTERALEATLERARRRARVRRTAVALVGAAAAVAVGLGVPYVGDGLRKATPPADAPTRLSGSWVGQIAPGDPVVTEARLAGTWRLTFRGGSVTATPPGAYAGTILTGRYGHTAQGLRTDLLAADRCATPGAGTYRVVRSGSRLTFRVRRDNCQARVALLSGHPWMVAETGPTCVTSGGGACLGDLAAGTYRTSQFRPAVTYTVPAGWANTQDLPGNLLLQPSGGDERFIGVYRNVTASAGCADRVDPDVGTSIEAIVSWLTSHPGLDVSNSQPVSLGGLTGVRLDVTLASDWRHTCRFSNGEPVVPILYGAGPAVLQHVVLPGFTERLYLLRADEGNIAIEVAPEGHSLTELLEAATPLLSSLRFDSD